MDGIDQSQTQWVGGLVVGRMVEVGVGGYVVREWCVGVVGVGVDGCEFVELFQMLFVVHLQVQTNHLQWPMTSYYPPHLANTLFYQANDYLSVHAALTALHRLLH